MMKTPLAALGLLLSACCCFSLAAFAAIITERNDVYNAYGCYTPSPYAFVGSSSMPGIESCWIPYGTYTGGTGSVEYVRVTDHLMGVVASALGGLSERSRHTPYMLRPLGVQDRDYSYQWLQDDGAFLESTTNLSLRIADQLNLPMMYVEKSGTNYTYTVTSGESNYLEPRILQCAELFGSRRLESLITAQGHSIEPPISSEWSSRLPYNVSDTNLWRYVYPVLGYCTNDIHFLPAGGIGRGSWNAFPYAWSIGSVESIWGADISSAYQDVVDAIDSCPLPFTIEDVLSYDTGWKYEVPPRLTNDYWTVSGPLGSFELHHYEEYDEIVWWNNIGDISDYYVELTYIPADGYWRFFIGPDPFSPIYKYQTEAEKESEYLDLGSYLAQHIQLYADTDDYTHWRNGTTRLDWKRLGIICQLERQMEIEYERSDVTDELPLYTMSASHELEFYSDNPIEVPISGNPRYNGEQWSYSDLFQGASWSQHDERYSSATNQTYWSTPTCRVPAPSTSPYMNFSDNGFWEDMELDGEHLEDLINDLAFTNGLTSISLYGSLIPSGQDSPFMYINYHYFASGTAEVEIPSNTVEVSATDGFHDSMWSMTPLVAGSPWNFSHDGDEAEIYLGTSSATELDVYYHTEDYNKSITCNAYYAFDNDSGSYTTPTITFIATGSGSVTNWLWDIPEFGSPECHMYESDGYVYWSFSGYNAYVYYYVADGTYDFGVYDDTGEAFLYYYYHDNAGGGLPRTFTFTNVTVDWDTSSYTDEEYVYLADPYDYYFPVAWSSPGTDHEAFAFGTLAKRATATFTYASIDTQAETINRFSNEFHDWSRIYSQRRSDLELLLYARGEDSMAYSTKPSYEDDFIWSGYLENKDHAGRLFRMLQGSAARTYQTANSARYDLLAGLSYACKTKCEDLGGMPVSSINNFAKITAAERAAFLKDLQEAVTIVTFRISAPDYLYIDANIHWDEESGRYILDELLYPTLPVHVGSYGFSAEATGIWSNSTTNSYNAARADGWQAPVNKTLYKFKNLRDPSL